MSSTVSQRGYEALCARKAAEATLEQVKGNWAYIRELSAKLKQIREANHFAEKIREAFNQ